MFELPVSADAQDDAAAALGGADADQHADAAEPGSSPPDGRSDAERVEGSDAPSTDATKKDALTDDSGAEQPPDVRQDPDPCDGGSSLGPATFTCCDGKLCRGYCSGKTCNCGAAVIGGCLSPLYCCQNGCRDLATCGG
jgi:hypothetical protein